MGNRLLEGKLPQYFTEPRRPTQPPTLSESGMNTVHSAVMLCGWGLKAGWLIPYVDKRMEGRCDPSLTRAI